MRIRRRGWGYTCKKQINCQQEYKYLKGIEFMNKQDSSCMERTEKILVSITNLVSQHIEAIKQVLQFFIMSISHYLHLGAENAK